VKQALTILFAVGTLVGAGCGGGDDDGGGDPRSYARDFKSLNQDVAELGQEFGSNVQATGVDRLEQLSDSFGNYAQKMGELQQRLDDLDPPEKLQEDQDKMVEAMGDVQGALESGADAAEQNDRKAFRTAFGDLLRSSAQLAQARQALLRATSSS
jgi:hypothetical protein